MFWFDSSCESNTTMFKWENPAQWRNWSKLFPTGTTAQWGFTWHKYSNILQVHHLNQPEFTHQKQRMHHSPNSHGMTHVYPVQLLFPIHVKKRYLPVSTHKHLDQTSSEKKIFRESGTTVFRLPDPEQKWQVDSCQKRSRPPWGCPPMKTHHRIPPDKWKQWKSPRNDVSHAILWRVTHWQLTRVWPFR